MTKYNLIVSNKYTKANSDKHTVLLSRNALSEDLAKVYINEPSTNIWSDPSERNCGEKTNENTSPTVNIGPRICCQKQQQTSLNLLDRTLSGKDEVFGLEYFAP